MLTRLRSRANLQVNLHLIRCLRGTKRPPRGGYIEQSGEADDYFIREEETEGQLDEISNMFGLQDNPRRFSSDQQHKRTAEKLEKEFLKEKIIERKLKNFYNPKETTLLTWAAKMQLKYLNKSDPVYWTPTMLANSFPVSKDSVLNILRSKRLPKNEAEIAKHDSKVRKNWLELKQAMCLIEEGRDHELDEDKRWLGYFGKRVLHLIPYAAGKASVAVPPSKFAFQTQEQLAEENKPVVKPHFSTILTSYDENRLRLKQKGASLIRPIDFEDESVLMLLQDISHQQDDKKSTKGDSEYLVGDTNQNKTDLEHNLDRIEHHSKKSKEIEIRTSFGQNPQSSKYKNRDIGVESAFEKYPKTRHHSDGLNENSLNDVIYKGDKERSSNERQQMYFYDDYDVDNFDTYFEEEKFDENQRHSAAPTYRKNNRKQSVLERVQQNFKRDTEVSDDHTLEQEYKHGSQTASSVRRNRQRNASSLRKSVDGSNYVGVEDSYVRISPLFKTR